MDGRGLRTSRKLWRPGKNPADHAGTPPRASTAPFLHHQAAVGKWSRAHVQLSISTVHRHTTSTSGQRAHKDAESGEEVGGHVEDAAAEWQPEAVIQVANGHNPTNPAPYGSRKGRYPGLAATTQFDC